jgi:adenosylcobinamide-phosphate synthase
VIAFVVCFALAFDWIAGEPSRWHPLVGFGRVAMWVERQFYAPTRWRGSLAVMFLVVPLPALSAGSFAGFPDLVSVIVVTCLLYFTIGHRSLNDHADAVVRAMRDEDESAARLKASYMVSRDRDTLDPAVATTESVLENGNDAVFGVLFWFATASLCATVLFGPTQYRFGGGSKCSPHLSLCQHT